MQRFTSLIEQHTKVPAATCPNIIHLAWVGSPLRSTHKQRLVKWRELNPSFEINLRYDAGLLSKDERHELEEFAKENNIILLNLTNYHTVEKRNHDLLKLAIELNRSKKGKVNFAIPTDFIRLIDLNENGGWWFDMDIIPLKSLPLNAQLPLQFRYYIKTNSFNEVSSQSPCIILSAAHSSVTSKALDVMRAFYNDKQLRDSIETFGNSLDARTRKTAATFSTGSLIEIALIHLRYKNDTCYRMDSSLHVHPELTDQLQAFVNDGYYQTKFEASYVFDENGKPLPGIEGYETYHEPRTNYNHVEPLRTYVLNYFYHLTDTVLLEPDEVTHNRALQACIDELCTSINESNLTLIKLNTQLDECYLLQNINIFKKNKGYINKIRQDFANAVVEKLRTEQSNTDIITLCQTARNHQCFAEPPGLWARLFGPSLTASQQTLEEALATFHKQKLSASMQ